MENEGSEKKENTEKEMEKESLPAKREENRPAQREKRSIRGKMDRKQRAKQFMPFSALKGLEEALTVEELKREE